MMSGKEKAKEDNATTTGMDTRKRRRKTKKSYKCEDCGQTFAQRKVLKAHGIEHGKNPYECHVCNIKFLWLNMLEHHLQSHYNYMCDFCCKPFTKKRPMTDIGDGNERPYVCIVCSSRTEGE